MRASRDSQNRQGEMLNFTAGLIVSEETGRKGWMAASVAATQTEEDSGKP